MLDNIVQTGRAVTAIATNTFREAVRNKIFGALLLFAGGVMAFSLVLGAMSLHNEVRVATDVTLFASTVFSVIITVYTSITLLQSEIDRRTIYTILSKPVRRWQFVIGKFAGIVLLAAVVVIVLFGVSAGLRLYQGGDLPVAYAWAFVLIFCQLLIVAPISLMFASFSSPLLSGLFTIGLFILGHLHSQLEAVASFADIDLADYLIEGLQVLIPNLASLNIATEVVHGISVPATYLLHAGWYTVSYGSLVLTLAIAIFSFRDLT
ncbi:MAG: ABC transporter permease [Bradymonadaceae bacterium]